ncbi:UNVERIFIED_CONTAM: dehydrogenase [Prevotella sp. 15_C9]
MADNFLEKHYEEYQVKKAEWLRKKKHIGYKIPKVKINKPEDEAL